MLKLFRTDPIDSIHTPFIWFDWSKTIQLYNKLKIYEKVLNFYRHTFCKTKMTHFSTTTIRYDQLSGWIWITISSDILTFSCISKKLLINDFYFNWLNFVWTEICPLVHELLFMFLLFFIYKILDNLYIFQVTLDTGWSNNDFNMIFFL